MLSMAAAADHDHHRHRLANTTSPPSGPPAPAPLPPHPHPQPHRRRLHSFSFPTLSWGTHRLLRCANNPASSPPPAAPDTPSPDKEKPRPPADRTAPGAAGSPQRPPQRPWNLRSRRSATVAPPAFGTSHDTPDAAAAPAPARHPEASSKRGFSVVLSKEEIADDFALFRGTRPPRRPKKRPRTLQRQIDSMCPGFCLADVTPETYKIEER